MTEQRKDTAGRPWFVFDRWAVAIGAGIAATFYLASGNRSLVGLAIATCAGVLFCAYSNRFWREYADELRDRRNR